MAYVIGDDCIACGTCIDECPVGAISEGDKYSMLAPSVELALVFVLQRLSACLHKTIQVNKEIRPFIYFEGFFYFITFRKLTFQRL